MADVIAELCTLLGIESEEEQQEFSLYCIVQGDAFTMPLAGDEYILDVTTELLKSGQPFYLIFCRSVWHFALKREPMPAPLYIEVLFNQVAPDYLEGLLLEMSHNNSLGPEMVRDMARIAALLHRAADLSHVPAMKEIKFLLPKPALGVRDIKPSQWVSLVQAAWPSVAGLSPNHVKAQFLVVLSSWPLFGSSFFAVKRVWSEENLDDPNPLWRELILALNRKGVLFLDPNTHETVQHWSFPEVISTRKVMENKVLNTQQIPKFLFFSFPGPVRGWSVIFGYEGRQFDATTRDSSANRTGARDIPTGPSIHYNGPGTARSAGIISMSIY